MYKVKCLILLLLNLTLTSASSIPTSKRALPPIPLSRDGGRIVDANGAEVPLVGINWPAAGEVMIPEGLQYQNISYIVSKIADMGFNVVRLTFATEMVDNIFEEAKDVSIATAFERGLGKEEGSLLLRQVLDNNKGFTNATTRLEVFDAVALELHAKNIYLHLDNHVSKGMWCCSPTDGNSWFGDTWFDTAKWTRGLAYMASYGKEKWPSFISIGLRNELREANHTVASLESYTWASWKTNMIEAATQVYSAAPDLLIFFSGIQSDWNIEPVGKGSTLAEPSFNLDISSYPFAQKFVVQSHIYDWDVFGHCPSYKTTLDIWGMDINKRQGGNAPAPLVVSEWGFSMEDRDGMWNGGYSACVGEFVVERKAGWMIWVIAGSYYTREGVRDRDEAFGLLDHTWSDYRGVQSSGFIRKLVKDSYAAYA